MNDNRCFLRAILSALYPVKSKESPHRPIKYLKHLNTFHFNGTEYSMKVSDISKFKKHNESLSTNVFGSDEGLYPIYVSKRGSIPIDLLLFNDKNNP